ncbi:MAG: transglutaminase family protein, partial [Minicystis sp.]
MRLLLQHHSAYLYPSPAALGPHLIRLRPATHTKATIETYSLRVPSEGQIHWQQDPSGTRVARLTFLDGVRIERLDIAVEMAVDIRPVNPFDFFVDDHAQKTPFAYPAEMGRDLLPFFGLDDPAMKGGPLLEAFLAELPSEGPTIPLVVECNRLVNERTRYVIREEAGIWTPEQTLEEGRGSCRDSAVLLIAALRSRGFAARFVSGYLIQLVDEGMIPNAPKGVGRDVVDLHAWAEVFLPGAGWIGLDATSGLLCGEGHIPLACTAFPALASPLEGTSDVPAGAVSFSMTVARLGHEPRPTTPYEEPVWDALCMAGARADQRLAAQGLTLTMGGEPTFNSREHAALPEWNEAALGATKWAQGLTLVSELKKRLAPGAAVILRAGKLYPGESLPRWALEICAAKDGSALWNDLALPTAERPTVTPAQAKILAEAIARELDLEGFLQPAHEDPWRFLQDEASLPVDVDPLHADLDDPEERRRLARVLDRGLGREAGFVLPLVRAEDRWQSERWSFRREHLFLVPGDSPIGLRLPLRSLTPAELPLIVEEPVSPPDPRRDPVDDVSQQSLPTAGRAPETHAPVANAIPVKVRTALSIELREGTSHVFLPPLTTAADVFAL